MHIVTVLIFSEGFIASVMTFLVELCVIMSFFICTVHSVLSVSVGLSGSLFRLTFDIVKPWFFVKIKLF